MNEKIERILRNFYRGIIGKREAIFLMMEAGLSATEAESKLQ